jgi:hypothetical protein
MQAMPRLFLFIRDARPAEAGLRSPSPKEISFATELVPSPHGGDGRAGACVTAGSPARTT